MQVIFNYGHERTFYTNTREKEMNKFKVILTAHSTPALPSRREGREFYSRLNQQSKHEIFAAKPGNPQYFYDEKYQEEWEKFGYSSSIISYTHYTRIFESDGFDLTPDYKFFCTLFDQMNKIVESYKKREVRETGGTVIGFGIFSRTLCVEETVKLNRAKWRRGKSRMTRATMVSSRTFPANTTKEMEEFEMMLPTYSSSAFPYHGKKRELYTRISQQSRDKTFKRKLRIFSLSPGKEEFGKNGERTKIRWLESYQLPHFKRTQDGLDMNWSSMRREGNSFYLKISLIARGFNTVFNEEVKDGKIR